MIRTLQLKFTLKNRAQFRNIHPRRWFSVQKDKPNHNNVLCPNKAKALQKFHVAPCHKPFYVEPLLMQRGYMQYLYDSSGAKYLDMFGGIVTVSVGHCHPYVVEAVERQMRELWHTTVIYMHPLMGEFSRRLTSKFPGDLKVAYLVNSGSEANDMALLLARLSTGNFEMLSLQNGYHGLTLAASGLTANANYRYAIPTINNGIHHVKNPNPFSGMWGGKKCRVSPVQTIRDCNCSGDKCQATDHYIEELQDEFKYSIPKGRCAGMIAECIQGVGGTVQPTKGYIKRAAELVRENGGIFISDEVQTGFGRTGDNFWGFESHDIVPDVVTMAKGIGNGFPLGAVVTTPKIAESLLQSGHFNTFGGNPLACAAGIAVLDVIEKEGLQENCKVLGTYFLECLAQLRDRYDIVGDVRGQGLMIGVEFVESKDTRAPLSRDKFQQIFNKTKDFGVLFGCGGYHANVLRIKPPMCINKNDVDIAINALDKSLQAVASA